jgi:hypothetical protein
MEKMIKRIAVVATILTIMFVNSISVLAASEGSNATIKDYLQNSDSVPTSVMAYMKAFSSKEEAISETDAQNKYYLGGDGRYYTIAKDDESKVETAIAQKKKDDSVAEDIKGINNNLGLVADTDSATVLLSGFIPAVSMLLGIAVVLLSIGLVIITIIDLCYIGFPPFQQKCMNSKQTGEGIMASKKTNNETGEHKLRIISGEAQYALNVSETESTGKSPYTIYGKKAMYKYIIIAILIFIVATGRMTIFTEIALKMVGGALDLLSLI